MFTIDDESRNSLNAKLSGSQAVRIFFGGVGCKGPAIGITVDEPRDDDERFDVGRIPVIVDPLSVKVVEKYGGVTIKAGRFGSMAELNNPPERH